MNEPRILIESNRGTPPWEWHAGIYAHTVEVGYLSKVRHGYWAIKCFKEVRIDEMEVIMAKANEFIAEKEQEWASRGTGK